MKYIYKRVCCQKCGKLIAENWLVRHRKSGCMKGIKAALDAAEECPDCAARSSETDSLCFMHRSSKAARDAAGGQE